MKYRLWNKLYAVFMGYYWLPCSICGQKFGGHEQDGGTLMTSWTIGECVCPDCKEEAIRRNKIWMKEHPPPAMSIAEGWHYGDGEIKDGWHYDGEIKDG